MVAREPGEGTDQRSLRVFPGQIAACVVRPQRDHWPYFSARRGWAICRNLRGSRREISTRRIRASREIKPARGRALVIAPGSPDDSPWLRKFGERSTAFASGWMQVRGPRRRRSLDRGFALSDHAAWDGLLASISATGAERIWATHGYTAPLVRWLREMGKNAEAIATRFGAGNEDEAESAAAPETAP